MCLYPESPIAYSSLILPTVLPIDSLSARFMSIATKPCWFLLTKRLWDVPLPLSFSTQESLYQPRSSKHTKVVHGKQLLTKYWRTEDPKEENLDIPEVRIPRASTALMDSEIQRTQESDWNLELKPSWSWESESGEGRVGVGQRSISAVAVSSETGWDKEAILNAWENYQLDSLVAPRVKFHWQVV